MYKIICGIICIILIIIDIIVFIKTPKEYKGIQCGFIAMNFGGIIFTFLPIFVTKSFYGLLPFVGFGAFYYVSTLIIMLNKLKEFNLIYINKEKRKQMENWK